MYRQYKCNSDEDVLFLYVFVEGWMDVFYNSPCRPSDPFEVPTFVRNSIKDFRSFIPMLPVKVSCI